MRGGAILSLIGLYIIADGVVSLWYYWIGTINDVGQFFRIIRAFVGVYLIWMGSVYIWNYQE